MTIRLRTKNRKNCVSRTLAVTHAETDESYQYPFNGRVPRLRIGLAFAKRMQLLALAIALVLRSEGVTSAANIFLEDEGVVSMEAENFTDRMDSERHAWEIVSTAIGVSGSASGGLFLSASPNLGANQTPFDPMLTPYVDYDFRLTTPGTYFLHTRMEAANGTGNDDSLWARIVGLSDGAGGDVADYYQIGLRHMGNGVFDHDADWDPDVRFFENNKSVSLDAAPWQFNAGDYTLRIHMREDGAALDKLVLKTSPAPPTGFGPPESVQFDEEVAGDFNTDGKLDVADLDMLTVAILGNTSDSQFDVDKSGAVDANDRSFWVVDVKETYFGDTDLNGQVNAIDLNTLALNWQRDDTTSWAEADFNGDGHVNALDLNDLALNWRNGVAAATSAPAVPEPSSITLLLLGVFAIARRSGGKTR